MKNVNSIVICRNEYKSKEEFENAIKDAVMVLLNNNYIMTVKYDEKGLGIVAIDYEYANQEFGSAYPYWLMPEEWESIVWNNEEA
mgnify:CR=1 FL=1